MRTNAHTAAPLGELIVAAFDEAAQLSSDPREVSRLAAGAVMHALMEVENERVIGLLTLGNIGELPAPDRAARQPGPLPAQVGGGAGR